MSTNLHEVSGNPHFDFYHVEESFHTEANCDFVVKVTVILYPKAPYNTDPIVMTRSYLPTYTVR